MTTIKQIQRLSIDIKRIIYSYDPTYRNIFNKVMKELNILLNNPVYSITVKKEIPFINFKCYRSIQIKNKYHLISCEKYNGGDRQYVFITGTQLVKYFIIDEEYMNFYDEDDEEDEDDEDEDEDDEEDEDEDDEEDEDEDDHLDLYKLFIVKEKQD